MRCAGNILGGVLVALAHKLGRLGMAPVASRSTVYRILGPPRPGRDRKRGRRRRLGTLPRPSAERSCTWLRLTLATGDAADVYPNGLRPGVTGAGPRWW